MGGENSKIGGCGKPWARFQPPMSPKMHRTDFFFYLWTRDFGTSAASIRIGWENPHESQVRQLLALVPPARRQNPPNQIYQSESTQVLSWYLNHALSQGMLR
jgi:hypothetical protein